MNTTEPIITIENLRVEFTQERQKAFALRGIDIAFYKDEIHGLVGESGSGKTVTAMSIMGLLPKPAATILSGSIRYEGKELLSLSEDALRTYRGSKIAMVFQEPAKYLNPAFTVGEQIREMVMLHKGLNKHQAEMRARELLGLVGLGKDGRALGAYPHELSSGMKQRAMIAIAISCDPDFLIADEPTTSLDVTLQLQILKLLKILKKMKRMGMLFISHDLSVIREIADRVSVIYAGKIVESASVARLFEHQMHPYTRLLLLSIPDARHRGKKLATIAGQVLDATNDPQGCVFAPRCPLAKELCYRESPKLIAHEQGHTSACHFAEEAWDL
ncbi:MAG: ABC transporter ATP-binding protein [Rectinema sp.]|jgi:oligopeptide/dipeptide ABC transporter ATP-binding protein|uniref:Dipeptide transporter ATP-binding component of ABC superfamily n=1 Tax=uncultured spirochete TaxID=156406 RepID=A0A3P3XSZ9_9SPIR|nr:dipeptide transporter; ATP-binding component of ABC superfamily [uncultured spirochete]